MISFIVCSVDPVRLERLKVNLTKTVGVDFEVVGIDNRGTSDGICKVYNEGARRAKFDILAFVHEDVEFYDKNWESKILDKLADPETGIVGFAGYAAKSYELSGLAHSNYPFYCSVVEMDEKNELTDDVFRSGLKDEFQQVVTLDGLCLIMRRDVYQKCPFDEVALSKFHLYDLDISTTSACEGYKNYVYLGTKIAHFSWGTFSKTWYEEMFKYQNKWRDVLPVYVERPDEKKIAKDEQKVFYTMTYFLMKKTSLDTQVHTERIKDMWKRYPFCAKNVYLTYRYLRYKIEHKTNNR